MSPDRIFLVFGALSAFCSVAGGAFGAHALRARLSPDLLDVFETAARYQMYHALSLLCVGVLMSRFASPWLAGSGWLFVAGTLLFSGSLYLLVLTGMRWLGAVTPLGGLAFLLGWALLAIGVARE